MGVSLGGIPMEGGDPRAISEALPAALDSDDPILITTSGSTGVPKTVVLTSAALRASATATAARIGEGSWLLALPATYVAGLQVLVRATLAGTRPAYLEGGFSPEAFAMSAARMAPGARYTSLVPAQLATLLDAAATDDEVRRALLSFERILIGAQAMLPPLRERAESAGVRVVRTYGSSETSGGCVYDGLPLDGVAVRTVGGELQISGAVLAAGYLGDAERTASVFATDTQGTRWYRTGDTAVVDKGVVRVTGRLDNVIVSGGINVSLDRVEAVVRALPGLADAVVIGVPDERWGEASVVVAPSDADDAASLLSAARAAVAEAIGPAARPARVERRPVPYLPSGKPDRQTLRAELRR